MSQDEQRNTKMLVDFYRERLLTLANLAKERRLEFFPLGADSTKSSYFIDRDENENYVHTLDQDEIVDELNQLWAGGLLPELAAIAEPLIAIAEILREKEQTSDEVSPFIYTMF